jgi:hypothetical protein
MPGMKGLIRRAVLAAAWLLIVALLALGAAGIVGTMAHQPGSAARAELTYLGDQAIGPGLSTAEDGLNALSDEVTQLSELGREALGALATSDVETLQASVDDGERLALRIQAHSADLRRQLEALPGVGPQAELVLSPAVRQRHALALAALKATDGIAADWSGLSKSALAATRMTLLLTDHDRVTGEAAAAGRAGKYPAALAKLTESDAMIAEARQLRDSLASTVDVSTLTQWLDISADYDTALRRLYEAIVAAKGQVTREVRTAFDAEEAARERLPPDTRALVVILSDIGRGGLNQAVIGIEQARGELDAAIGLLTSQPGGASETP